MVADMFPMVWFSVCSAATFKISESVVSSMNIDTCSFFDMGSTTAMFGSLLTFAIKAKGPILLPCGTPAFTSLKLDSSPSNYILCMGIRSERYDANQGAYISI